MYKLAFFGSDRFSLRSFKALLDLRARKPNLVKDIELVTRKLKPSGRGMKNVVVPEIATLATEVGVPWHQVELAEDFNALSNRQFNLAVAVSYGTLIPASFLTSLQHGGLNVHPSLLPQLRGAAPLQYAIMQRMKHTGVSVQTLHPSKFDRGKVLWRSKPYVLGDRITLPQLSADLSVIGAGGLCTVLENHLNPLCDEDLMLKPSRAPVIDPKMRRIDFTASLLETDAKGRALEKLYFEQIVTPGKKRKGLPQVRVNLTEFEVVDHVEDNSDCEIGSIKRGRSSSGETLLALKLPNGFLGAKTVTVQGFKQEPAEQYFENIEKRRLANVITNI